MHNISLHPKKIINLDRKWIINKEQDFKIGASYTENSLLLDVNKINSEAAHTYITYDTSFNSSNFDFSKKSTYIAFIEGEISNNLDIQLVVTSWKNNKKLSYTHIGMDLNKIINIPYKANKLSFALRISGSGKAQLNKIQILCYEATETEVEQSIFNTNSKAEYLILTNAYPEKNNLYRNMFVHRRALLYRKNGIQSEVFRFNLTESKLGNYEYENISIFSGDASKLTSLLDKKKYKKILIHFVDKDMMEAIKRSSVSTPMLIWIHGVETEKWYRRWFNFSYNANDLERALASIPSNQERINFMKSLYENKELKLKFIFVSKWFKEVVAESDTNTTVNNYSIIHNVIDNHLFKYVKKDREQRKKILSIRPYASHKYANDLSVKAILELSRKDYFEELEFSIYGHGPLFNKILEPIRHFKNVSIHNHFLSQEEVAALHKQHGIFLCPTRLDSQGVSMCEAMSSGLVPITNGVTAIPEFVDEQCGYLAGKEDYQGLANAISFLYFHPEEFQKKSLNSSQKIQKQCGVEKILQKEINEIIN